MLRIIDGSYKYYIAIAVISVLSLEATFDFLGLESRHHHMVDDTTPGSRHRIHGLEFLFHIERAEGIYEDDFSHD